MNLNAVHAKFNRLLRFINTTNEIKAIHGKKIMIHIIVSKIYNIVMNKFCYLIAIPFVLLILIIRKFKKIKFIKLYGHVIGHYLLNTELMLCSKNTSLYPNDDTWTLYYHTPVNLSDYKNRFCLSRKYPLCNHQVYKMWKRKITIIPFYNVAYWISQHLSKILKDKYTIDPQRHYEILFAGCIDHHGLLEKEKSFLNFIGDELNKGRILLNQMGIPPNSRYVCLLVRDGEYQSDRTFNFNNKVIDVSISRNANIDNFKKAALFLVSKGFYVVRMGSKAQKPFIVNHPMIIDYAASNLRSDFMDIYLSAHCSFFISTGTGLDSAAHVFRKPILLTNVLLTCAIIHYPVKIFILKKFLDKNNNQFLSLQDIVNLNNNVTYPFNRLKLIENSDEEILEATKDMLLSIQGKFTECEDYKILHETLSTLLIKNGQYINSLKYPPKCSRKFLLDNRAFIMNEQS
jgi:putative glycosyltransferase (TIGR04372 family)